MKQDQDRTNKWSTDVERLLDRAEQSHTHYEVLGLSPSVGAEEVASAYCYIVECLQPAREALSPSNTAELGDQEVAAIKRSMLLRLDRAFGRVVLAFSVLSSAEKRQEYDHSLCAELANPTARAPEPADAKSEAITGSLLTDEGPAKSDLNRRWDQRYNLYIPAHVVGYDEDSNRWEEPAETVDVCQAGVTFRIRRRLRVGAIVQVSLPLPTRLRMHGLNEPVYDVYAIVRRVEPSKKGVRLVAVEFIGAEPPAGYRDRPSATYRSEKWDGQERRRNPREPHDAAILVEYFNESIQSIRREAGRTENISQGGLRIRVRSAPADCEYVKVRYPDGGVEAFTAIRDRFVGEDNLERLCLRFIGDDEVASIKAYLNEEDVPVIALGPPPANRPSMIAPRHHQASVLPEVRPDAGAPEQAGVKAQVLRSRNFRRRKILLADDDAPLRKVLARILDHAGYEVTAVEDGERAVARAAAEQPDLVITDALMPKLHGFLVCKTVKGFTPAPKVIMLTAVYTKPGYKWEARDKYGADELITKPFNVPDLLSAVEKQLARHSSGPEGV